MSAAPLINDVDRCSALTAVYAAVCEHMGVGTHFIRSDSRLATIVQARAVAMRLMRDDLGMTLSEVGRECGGRSRQSVQSLLEDHDCPEVDRWVSVCQETLRSLKPSPRPRRLPAFDEVLDLCCERFGVGRAQVCSPTRTWYVVRARTMVCYLAHEFARMSYPEIAKAMGLANHSSTITAARRAPELLRGDGETSLWARECLEAVQGRMSEVPAS